MNKIKLFLVFALIVASQVIYAQKRKVAVVTFYANKMVGFSDLGAGFDFILKDIINLRDDPNFNLSPLLKKYHDNFFNTYAKQFPFDLLNEKDVIETEKYQAFEPKWDSEKMDKFVARNYEVYDKYKYIYEGALGKANEEGMAKLFADEADGVLFINIDFGFEPGIGIGKTMSIKMRATTRIALYNKTGNKVFAFSERERSKKTMVMVGGVPIINPDKILPMCESALEELMADLDKRIAKVIKTTDAKL